VLAFKRLISDADTRVMPLLPAQARGITLALGVVFLFALGVPSLSAAATTGATPTATAVEASVLPFLAQELKTYGSTYRQGAWVDPEGPDCWACDDGGPATAAATAYVLGQDSDPQLLSEAEQTIDTAISTRQSANGGFSGPPADAEPEDISTMFFGVEFGTVYYLLGADLPNAMRQRWQKSLASAADYLINSGSTTWYSNGNINLGFTEFLWMVWHATGETRFLNAYNASWQFTMDPPKAKFPGDGWVTVKSPSDPSGSDGRGYFAEAGSGGTGYDAEYSMLQLDVASRLYLLSGDNRALKAANMLMNMEMPRVNTHSWMLQTSDGSRHTETDRYVGFQTSAFAVLGLHAGRTDLLQYVMPELQQDEVWYPQPEQADSPVFRRAIGDSVSVIALAAAVSDSASSSSIKRLAVIGRRRHNRPAVRRTR
jgi:hypothetical protein